MEGGGGELAGCVMGRIEETHILGPASQSRKVQI